MQIVDIFVIFFSVILVMFSFFMLIQNGKYEIKNFGVYFLFYLAISLVITATLLLVYKDNSVWHDIKRVCLISILGPVAYVDYKEYIIPNKYIVFGLISWVIISISEFMFNGVDTIHIITSELVAAIAVFVATLLCKICIKNSIGAGDVKLFLVVGLLLGLEGIWGAMFLALIVAFVQACYLLIRKKKSKKDCIAFGPAMTIGVLLSVFLTGM